MKTTVPSHLYLPSVILKEKEYHYHFLKKTLTQEKTLSFDFTFIHNGKTNDDSKQTVVKINRSNLLINKEKPDETLIGELLSHSSQALFPLRVSVNSYGFPKKLCNHAEILERWKSFIPRLEDYYDVGKATDLLNRVSKIYKNPGYLFDSLKNDLFFSVFFLPVYGDYGLSRISVIDDFEFTFTPGQKEKYSLELEILNEYTENGKIKILVHGTSHSTKDNTVSGYFLLNKDRSIHKIEIVFYFSAYNEEIKIHVFETKETAEVKTGINVVFDEQEERKKLSESKRFFLEEIKNSDLIKHNITR